MTCLTRATVAVALAFAALVPAHAQGQVPASGGSRVEQERKLIAVLQSGAPAPEKARACQQLAIVGTEAAVPALEALLSDGELSSYARDSLEAIPAPSAGDALRRAMSRLKGRLLVGVINSVGVRRDVKVVGALARYAGQRDSELASASLTALGRIATPDAMRVLERSLAVGPSDIRSSAADALLAVADRSLAQGRREEAAGLYERVRRAGVPRYLRLAAIQRSLIARRSAGIPQLVALLRSGDPATVAVALRVVRALPEPDVTRALAAELAKARPQVQVRLIQALLERGGPAVLPAIEAVAGTGSADARLEALRALGEIGGASSIPILLKAIESAPNDDAGKEAAASLTRLAAPDTDAAILKALPSVQPAVQAKLLAILADRRAESAADTALKLAGDSDSVVSKAAFSALVSLCRPGDLPEIVRLMVKCRDESVREAAGRAVLAAAARLPDISSRTDAIAAALRETQDSAARQALLGILGEIGTYRACAIVKSALGDGDPGARAAAVRSLAGWPDPTPTAALLAAAQSAADPAERSVALRGAIRLASALAVECARPSRQAVEWLAQANRLVREDADEKRLILSALGSLKSVEGLVMVRPYLADTVVQSEAELAAIQIARQMPAEQQPMARPVIEKIAAASGNESIRRQAEEVLKQLPAGSAELTVPAQPAAEADPTKLVFRPLFDGRSFEGWEGDTAKTFRIEDGAIVGGSLKTSLPKNEFLCTTRSYANFILRAECRLTGANGGIQIRSQRVPMSSEVCGYQADMDSGGSYWGCLYDESRRGMLVQADQARMKAVVKQDGWNAYEIRCEGPRIRLFVNGTLTVDYTEKDSEILQSGVIGLQIHGGQPSESWYRNITIAELP
jgi:HEAT repeat protein